MRVRPGHVRGRASGAAAVPAVADAGSARGEDAPVRLAGGDRYRD